MCSSQQINSSCESVMSASQPLVTTGKCQFLLAGLKKIGDYICSYFELYLSKWRQHDNQGAYSIFLPSRQVFSFVRALNKKGQ